MGKFLYGNNVEKACYQCSNGTFNRADNTVFCEKKKKNVAPDFKCISFDYDPLLRKVKPSRLIESVDPEDMKL
jgi:hypothetical protein